MAQNDELYRWQFEKLLTLHEEGRREELEDLSQKVIAHAGDMLRPLAEFTLDQPPHPRTAILLELLGKMGDRRAASTLLKFLDSHVKELRMQACHGLGWIRARVALESLDQIEANDPDGDVRHEARVAIEEILRDFPNLRKLLKHHKPLIIAREEVVMDSESAIASIQPLSDEHRQFLVGRLPRLLALRYKAVPIYRQAPDLLVLAIPADPEFEQPIEDLRRITGCNLELRGWPLNHIYERLLTFYEWGDDDWVQFSHELTDDALREISQIVCAGINPDEPHSPLPDCTDTVELAQSFLSLCIQRKAVSAVLEFDDDRDSFAVYLNSRDGRREELDPPAPHLRLRFLRAMKMLADCDERLNDSGQLVGGGAIRTSQARMDRPFVAVVRCETLDNHQIMALDFPDAATN